MANKRRAKTSRRTGGSSATKRGSANPKAADYPRLRDRIRPGLDVLFVGINPGIRSAQTGHHFAGFSNRFWKLLYDAKLVPRPVTCEDDDRLPEWGYGITNLVKRPTAGLSDLHRRELAAGRHALVAKIARYKPRLVALVGITVYRALFPSAARREKRALPLGLQPERLAGVPVFVLPNPSGRNANFLYAEMLDAFRALVVATNQSTQRTVS